MAIRIQTGDRAPNFALPRTAEAATMFYEFARGVPMLLYFFDRIDQGPGHDGFEALVARSAAIAEHGQVLAVCRSPVAATSAALERRDLNFVVVSDEPGHVSAAFAQGAGRASSDGLTFLLDANQRVIEVVPGAGAPAVEAAWARLSDLPRPAGGSQRDALAPVLIIPNVLDDAWCRRIIEIWRTRGHEEGSVATTRNEAGRAINYGAKKRLDHHVTDLNLARDIALTIGPRLASETTKAFFFDEFKLDSFVICAYDSARGDFFKPHRDNLIPALAHRRFAVTINLNTDEFEGGGLRFAEYGAHTYRPPQGGAIVFSCSLLHEVLSPTKGTRFALLTFLLDPKKAPPPG